MRAARRRRRTSELEASWWSSRGVMAFSAVAEAQGSSRAQIRSDRQNGFTAGSKSRASRVEGRGTPCLNMRAGDEGGFPAPPSAANQSGRRRSALAARSRLKRIAVADDRKSARRRGEPAHSAQARVARPRRARDGLRRPALTWTEGRADNFSLDINFVTGA